MILHHTTTRSDCESIARKGLVDSEEGYVHLTPQIWSRRDNWIIRLEGIFEIGRDEVVLIYDVPDEVAEPCHITPTIIHPGDPDHDPDIKDYDPEVDGPWDEYRIPAELVNKYFVGVAFWHGECPFDSTEIEALWRRRFGDV